MCIVQKKKEYNVCDNNPMKFFFEALLIYPSLASTSDEVIKCGHMANILVIFIGIIEMSLDYIYIELHFLARLSAKN